MKNNKRIFLIVVIIISVCVILLSLTYSFWVLTVKQQRKNIVKTACLDLEFSDNLDYDSGINISYENAWPMSDDNGIINAKNRYKFTIINKCDKPTYFRLGIQDVLEGDNKFNYSSITVALNGNKVGLFSELENLNYLNNSNVSKMIDHGTIDGNSSIDYTFQIWVNENSTSAEIGSNFKVKLFVVAGQGVAPNTEIISGDLNTLGSEVAIGDEHFYVVGDDTEVLGNVNLLAKYNLLVGDDIRILAEKETKEDCISSGGSWDIKDDFCIYSSGTISKETCESKHGKWYPEDNECNIDLQEYCIEVSGVWNSDKDQCVQFNQIPSSLSNYNMQSNEARGAYCTNPVKSINYTCSDCKDDCEESNGIFRDGECAFYTELDDNSYDNLSRFGIPNYIGTYCNDKLAISGVVYLSNHLFDENNRHISYWMDDYNTINSNYNRETFGNAFFIYYDSNKNIDSNNLIAPYINVYKDKLEGLYDIIVYNARLLSVDDILPINCGENESLCPYYNPWLFSTSFWTGTAENSNAFAIVNGYKQTITSEVPYKNQEYDYPIAGVRPVISVSKKIFYEK